MVYRVNRLKTSQLIFNPLYKETVPPLGSFPFKTTVIFDILNVRATNTFIRTFKRITGTVIKQEAKKSINIINIDMVIP